MTPRPGTLVSMLLVALAAFGLYMVKYRVQAIQNEIASVGHQLDEERENLHVAAAEWAYLTRPERLQRLSAKYLKLEPMKTGQVADIGALHLPDDHNRNPGVVLSASTAPAPGGEE